MGRSPSLVRHLWFWGLPMLMHTSTSYPFQVEFRNSDGGVASEITSLAVETLRVPEHVAPSGGAGTRTAPR